MGVEDKGKGVGAQEKNRDRQGSMEPQAGGRVAEARESSLQDGGEAERGVGARTERERQYGRIAESAAIAARQLAQRSKASSQRKRCEELIATFLSRMGRVSKDQMSSIGNICPIKAWALQAGNTRCCCAG